MPCLLTGYNNNIIIKHKTPCRVIVKNPAIPMAILEHWEKHVIKYEIPISRHDGQTGPQGIIEWGLGH